MRFFYSILLLEASLIAILCFGDIGFDKPGKYGLDFDAGIFLVICYVVTLALGVGFAVKRRRFWLIGLQFLPICGFCVSLLLPDRHYDAARYQYLIGKSDKEFRRELGSDIRSTEFLNNSSGKRDGERVYLNGISVLISPDGIVLRVEANNR